MNKRTTVDSDSGANKRAQTLSPTSSSAHRANQKRFTDERNESTLSDTNDHKVAIFNHDTVVSANMRVASVELQLDSLLEHLGGAYAEIYEQKKSMSEMLNAYSE